MPDREHAIVMGGSIAGLLAARTLSDFYRNVTIVERDRLDDDVEPRKAIPQGRHVHALLARGQQILEGLFPGLTAELATAGSPIGDFGTGIAWYFGGRKLKQTHTDMVCVVSGRPLLEQRIRRRVTSLPNVRLLDGAEVTGLRSDAGRTRVTGATVHRAGQSDGASQLAADLVVDAGGRGSRLPGWLSELGYPEVGQESVNVGLGYVTWQFKSLADFDPIGDDLGLVPVATPDSPRGAIFARFPDRYVLSVTGLRGDHPPREHGEFLAFIATLPVPEIHRAVASLEPMGPPATYHYTASVQNHYERMKRFPAGVVPLGDAFSSFNPIYGQGMTVAAMGADLLRRHIERHETVRAAVFVRELAKLVSVPWALAVGSDLAFPQTEGKRTPMIRFANAYIDRLQRAAVTDPALARAFLRVTGLMETPNTLFRPTILARVIAA